MRNIIKQVLKEEIDSKSGRVKSIVNKYGFERAIEMVAGGKETIRNAYLSDPLSYLDQFNNLTPVEMDDKIYYINNDGNPLFYYYPNRENKILYINMSRLQKFFSYIIGLGYFDTNKIIVEWLADKYGLIDFKFHQTHPSAFNL
jgi:hypothetical protein